MRRRIGWRGGLALALAALGVASVGEAALLHAKARLGQALIARAWLRAEARSG